MGREKHFFASEISLSIAKVLSYKGAGYAFSLQLCQTLHNRVDLLRSILSAGDGNGGANGQLVGAKDQTAVARL